MYSAMAYFMLLILLLIEIIFRAFDANQQQGVINYEFPHKIKTNINRIVQTGRYGTILFIYF